MGGAAAETDARALEPGQPVERALAGGETHTYQLPLASGQYVRLVVDPRGIDVAVTAFGPDGKKLTEVDNTSGTWEPEAVSLVAVASGDYRLEVRSPEKNALAGRYEVKVVELRAATAQDKSRAAAEAVVAEAKRLYNQQTTESRRRALEQYQDSLALWRAAGDPIGEAAALSMVGSIYMDLGEREKALDFCNRALRLARAAGDRKSEGATLDGIGMIYNNFGDKRKALEFFDQALPLRQAAGDRAGEAHTLNSLAMAHHWLGERQKALDLFDRALRILRALGDRRKEATVLGNVGVTYTSLGEYQKALDFFNRALRIHRELTNRQSEAVALSNMGNAHSNLGEYQQALAAYHQALAIDRALGDRWSEAIALNNIGWVYSTLGEYRKALDFYDQALEPLRAIGDRLGEATTLNNIGVAHANLGEYPKALAVHQRVLPLRRAVGDPEGQAITLNNIGRAYSNLGEKQKALDYYGQALTLHRSVGNRHHMATSLNNIGALYRDLGERRKALDHLTEALRLRQTIGDRNGEAATLFHMACLERDRGDLLEARHRIEAALAAVESVRINVASQQLRASFFASVRKYHEFHIDLLMRLHKQHPSEGLDALALQASERARARGLLDLLGEARADIRQGVDPALLERERALRRRLAAQAERQTRLLSGKSTEEQAAAAAKEVSALTTEYEQVQARIRQASPHYAALMQPVPLSLKEIQTEVLDDETLLLEYALGEEKSFLWAMTPTSVDSFELPGRAELEAVARRVYEALTVRNRPIANETPEQRRRRVASADTEYPKASAALSRMLLGPVASRLGSKRLLIAGEGVLQYVPFAALPAPAGPTVPVRMKDKGGRMKTEASANHAPLSRIPHPSAFGRPLIVEHEIVYLPSASVLAVLRRETAGRQPAAKAVAVLADPVFHDDDPRVGPPGRARGVQEASSVTDVRGSAAESGLAGFVRLRFSRQEAEQITRLVPEGERLKALDFAASRTTATGADLGRYRIVHLATHGLINSQHPELSGVVLSLVDERGQPQDGFLRLYDIYNLKLGTDLVVLSACQTALGKEVKGEGLVGLTRGFMYAGAPRVVASLWQIDDKATAELMKRFYERMLEEGLRPAAALRAAQVSLWKDRRWVAPHYWAAFTLQGEWK